jgi:hypothetical protein
MSVSQAWKLCEHGSDTAAGGFSETVVVERAAVPPA